MNLATALQQETNYTFTENGALTFASSLSNTLDLFALGAAQRNWFDIQLFSKAFAEDEKLAITCAFYIRDVRGGQGERRTFRKILTWLADVHPKTFIKVLPLISEYGRWDDVLHLLRHENVSANVISLVKSQFGKDLDSDKPSLLAKWLPSENASSAQSRRDAVLLAKEFGYSKRDYRKALSNLREKLRILERDMSSGNWAEINYSRVPSKAMLIHGKNKRAFTKHDQTRFEAFREAAKNGEAKINSSTLYPYELVNKYLGYGNIDNTIEAQWKQLPNYCEQDGDQNALVVCDVSGSMSGRPMEVSVSLGIYCGERIKGFFNNQFITFSDKPKLQRIQGSTLFERVKNLSQAEWGMSTNLQSVFNLILNAGLKHNVPQSEMPSHVFIVSDMEFNSCTSANSTNFEAIQKKYEAAGYKMPVLVFWNVNARSQQSLVTKDENGVYLVSGCSPSIFKSAINTKAITPQELMVEVLTSKRYQPVLNALV